MFFFSHLLLPFNRINFSGSVFAAECVCPPDVDEMSVQLICLFLPYHHSVFGACAVIFWRFFLYIQFRCQDSTQIKKTAVCVFWVFFFQPRTLFKLFKPNRGFGISAVIETLVLMLQQPEDPKHTDFFFKVCWKNPEMFRK